MELVGQGELDAALYYNYILSTESFVWTNRVNRTNYREKEGAREDDVMSIPIAIG